MGQKYPAAPGFRDIGSTTMQYIPVSFSGKMQKKLYSKLTLAAISNTDYEGEIKKYNDSVIIRSLPDIEIHDYAKSQVLRNQQPDADSITLDIDKGKYWSFVADDVDDAQTDLKGYVGKWADVAARQMKIHIERSAYADFPSDAAAANIGNSAGALSGGFELGATAKGAPLTRANFVDRLVEWGAILDEQDVDDENRFVVVPSWAASLLKTSDLKQAQLTGDATSPVRNGLIGKVDRFNIYTSNLLNVAAGKAYDTSTDANLTDIVFGTNDALTFATQLVKTKVQDNPDGFGTLFRGLQVYGYKVVLPEALGVVKAYNGDVITGA